MKASNPLALRFAVEIDDNEKKSFPLLRYIKEIESDFSRSTNLS